MKNKSWLLVLILSTFLLLLLSACGGGNLGTTPPTASKPETSSSSQKGEESAATYDDIDSWPKSWALPAGGVGGGTYTWAAHVATQFKKEHDISVTPMEGAGTANIRSMLN